MKAVILAAGRGKRMMPLTTKIPKPMVNIHGKPILEHILNILPSEIKEVLLVTGYKEEVIKKHFGKKFKKLKIKYFYQKEANGVWKALKLAQKNLKKEEKFLLVFADDMHDKNSLKKLVKEKNAIMAYEHPEPNKFGVIEKDEMSFLINIEEKPLRPKTNLVATGMYVLGTDILRYSDPLPQNGEYYITSVFNEYIKNNKIKVVVESGWQPIGTPEDVIKAHESSLFEY
jgi:NDP-sugar pyrophosphorylase family protein